MSKFQPLLEELDWLIALAVNETANQAPLNEWSMGDDAIQYAESPMLVRHLRSFRRRFEAELPAES